MIAELGSLVLLFRAWQAAPNDPELRPMLATSQACDAVLVHPEAKKVEAAWEVLGEQISTRRDGMVGQATWLMNLDGGAPSFALLLDFFPVSLGKRTSAFDAGEQFRGAVAFYPARVPLRAVLTERAALGNTRSWPDLVPADPVAPLWRRRGRRRG
ncbi:MAG: hypothetical protein AAGC57_06440 [Pseudomonadota bacterium]